MVAPGTMACSKYGKSKRGIVSKSGSPTLVTVSGVQSKAQQSQSRAGQTRRHGRLAAVRVKHGVVRAARLPADAARDLVHLGAVYANGA